MKKSNWTKALSLIMALCILLPAVYLCLPAGMGADAIEADTVFKASDYAKKALAKASGLNGNSSRAFTDVVDPWSAELLFDGFDWKYGIYDWHEADIVYARWNNYHALSQQTLNWGNTWRLGDTGHHRANSVNLDPNNQGNFLMIPQSAFPQYGLSSVGLAFKVPADGRYAFAPESGLFQTFKNINPINSSGTVTGSVASVRITVNGRKIWPADKAWLELTNGVSEEAIPRMERNLNEGDVFRIEVKSENTENTDENEYRVNVTASAQMTYLGEIEVSDTGTVFAASEYAYDCLDAAGGLAENSDARKTFQSAAGPWAAELLFENFDWKQGVYTWTGADIIYAKWWGYHALSQNNLYWQGGWNPGFPEHHRANSVMLDPNAPGDFRFVPNNQDPQWGYSRVGLSFKAPDDGWYEFAPEKGLTQVFKNAGPVVPTPGAESTAGVRITVNGKKIWPIGSDWLALKNDGTEEAIPRIQYNLLAGEVFRIEAIWLGGSVNANCQIAVTASGQMTYLGKPLVLTPDDVFAASDYAKWAEPQSAAGDWTALSAGNPSPWFGQVYDNRWQYLDSVSEKDDNRYALAPVRNKTWDLSVAGREDMPEEFRLTPLSLKTDAQFGTANSALCFASPGDGYYEFSPEGAVTQFVNTQALTNQDAAAKAGVRITVNGKKIWPENADWLELAVNVPQNIPTLAFNLRKGDVFRIEATALSAETEAHGLVTLAASGQMTYVSEMIPEPIGPGSVLPASEYAAWCKEQAPGHVSGVDMSWTELEGKNPSPWTAQTFDREWKDVGSIGEDTWDSYALCNSTFQNWLLSVPLRKNIPGQFWLVPFSHKDDSGSFGVLNTALSFTSPEDGRYEFSPEGVTTHFENTQGAWDHDPKAVAGVRITVNGVKIWPENADWLEVNVGEPEEIPTLECNLQKGDIFRVESKAVFAEVGAFCLATVTVSGQMTYLRWVDTVLPVFSTNGRFTLDEVSENYLSITWPTAQDNLTASKDIVYSVYVKDIPMPNVPYDVTPVVLTGKTSLKIENLQPNSGYYFLVRAADEENNYAYTAAGPFRTRGVAPPPEEEPDFPIEVPGEPLKPNVQEQNAGIISAEGNNVTIGWIPQSLLIAQRVFVFRLTDDGYTLYHYSGSLSSDASQYTMALDYVGDFTEYVFQVVGYNIQGDPTAVFQPIEFTLERAGQSGNSGNWSNTGTNTGHETDDELPVDPPPPSGNTPGGTTNNPQDPGEATAQTLALLPIILGGIAAVIVFFGLGVLASFFLVKAGKRKAQAA